MFCEFSIDALECNIILYKWFTIIKCPASLIHVTSLSGPFSYHVEIGKGGLKYSIFFPITAFVLRCKFADEFILKLIVLFDPRVDA